MACSRRLLLQSLFAERVVLRFVSKAPAGKRRARESKRERRRINPSAPKYAPHKVIRQSHVHSSLSLALWQRGAKRWRSGGEEEVSEAATFALRNAHRQKPKHLSMKLKHRIAIKIAKKRTSGAANSAVAEFVTFRQQIFSWPRDSPPFCSFLLFFAPFCRSLRGVCAPSRFSPQPKIDLHCSATLPATCERATSRYHLMILGGGEHASIYEEMYAKRQRCDAVISLPLFSSLLARMEEQVRMKEQVNETTISHLRITV